MLFGMVTPDPHTDGCIATTLRPTRPQVHRDDGSVAITAYRNCELEWTEEEEEEEEENDGNNDEKEERGGEDDEYDDDKLKIIGNNHDRAKDNNNSA
jgi:hypothetical protein